MLLELLIVVKIFNRRKRISYLFLYVQQEFLFLLVYWSGHSPPRPVSASQSPIAPELTPHLLFACPRNSNVNDMPTLFLWPISLPSSNYCSIVHHNNTLLAAFTTANRWMSHFWHNDDYDQDVCCRFLRWEYCYDHLGIHK